LLYQLLGGTGVGKLPQLAPRPWLSGEASESIVAKFTICRIVTSPRSCLKFISGWCLG
jgi:hypothetical protein